MNKVSQWMSAEGLAAGVEQVRAWVVANVLTVSTLAQIVALVAAFALARMLAPAIRAWFDGKLIARVSEPRVKRIAYAPELYCWSCKARADCAPARRAPPPANAI